jgi:hypothetical protein
VRSVPRSLIPSLQALGVSSIPVVGTVAAGWSAATSLALYWCENLLGALLVAVLIARHRGLTRKRGHWRAQLGATSHSTLKVKGKRRVQAPQASGAQSFLAEFLITALGFNLGHGIALALLLGVMLPTQGAAPVDPAGLGSGLLALALVLLAVFAYNLFRLRDRPFAWLRRTAQLSLSRMALIHVTIIFGVLLAAWTGRPERFFLVFAVLKLVADVTTSLPLREIKTPDEAPRWVLRLGRLSRPELSEEELREDWRKTIRQDRQLLEQDEEERPISRWT